LHSNQTQHVYEVRPRKDKHGADLISEAAAIWPTLVWPGWRRDWLREILQPLTLCSNSRFRWIGHCDRNI